MSLGQGWRIVPLLCSCLAAQVEGQTPAAGVYRIYQGSTEVGRETFRLVGDTLDHESLVPVVNLRVASRTTFAAGGGLQAFSMTVMNAAGDSTRGTYRVVVSGDSLRITSQLGRASRETLRLGRALLVVPPQSTYSLIELLRRTRTDTTALLLIAGADTLLPATTSLSGDSARVSFAGLEIHAARSGASVTSLTIPAQWVRVVLAGANDTLPSLAGLRRPTPDYRAPAGAAWTAQEVRVPAGIAPDTFSLGCTLTRPSQGRPPFPAAVTITGSGLQTRDEDLWPLVRGYRLFGEIAERLGTVGLTTLRCDDRGIGSSGGRADSATSADLAEDTRAQLRWLRRQPGIDPRRLVLVGHSEGGLIAPLLAAQEPSIAALVLLAGPGKNGTEILVDQVRWPIQSDSALAAEARATRLREAEIAIRADSFPASPWLRWFRHYEPLKAARLVRQPVLILQGALDRQVSAGQADTLAQAIRGSGNRRVTVSLFPGLNHLFLRSAADGSPAEYPALSDVRVPTEVLDRLAGWLVEVLGTPQAGR